MPSTESFAHKAPGRRQCVPVIYTKGTHYEVGYDIVSTSIFGKRFYFALSTRRIYGENDKYEIGAI